MILEAGAVFRRFRVLGKVGEGGMCSVLPPIPTRLLVTTSPATCARTAAVYYSAR
jgi:hypothetical protein